MKGQEKKEKGKKDKTENKTKVMSEYQREKQSKGDRELTIKPKA